MPVCLTLLLATVVFAQTPADSPQAGQAWTDPATGIELRWIPAGSFLMGSPEDEGGRFLDEGPQHEVRLSQGFWLGTLEVTQAQYESVMGARPSDTHSAGAQVPVNQVSWNDACAFLGRLNALGSMVEYRLPTEAQWEYACRANAQEPQDLDASAWYSLNSGGAPRPVGEKQANTWGLRDMRGNVWEWCQDWYGEYPSAPSTDPTGPSNGTSHVLRGGSWLHTSWYSRAACRRSGPPAVRLLFHGFRVAALPKTRTNF